MMGYHEENHQALVTKTTGGVIVLPADHIVVRRHRRDWKEIAAIGRSACDQCSFCTELCPRWLLGHPIQPHTAMRSLGFNEVGEANVIGTQFCCECNLCSMYSCPEDLDPKKRLHAKQASIGRGEETLGESAVQRTPGRSAHEQSQGADFAVDDEARIEGVSKRRAASRGAACRDEGRNQAEAAHRRSMRAGRACGRTSRTRPHGSVGLRWRTESPRWARLSTLRFPGE